MILITRNFLLNRLGKKVQLGLGSTPAFKTYGNSKFGRKMDKGSDYKGPGGKLIRIRLAEERQEIRSIKITGDFFLVPEESLGKLETMLVDAPMRGADLRVLIDRFFKATGAQTIGASTDDFVNAILSAKEIP